MKIAIITTGVSLVKIKEEMFHDSRDRSEDNRIISWETIAVSCEHQIRLLGKGFFIISTDLKIFHLWVRSIYNERHQH